VNAEDKILMENIRASRNIMHKVAVGIQSVLQRTKGKRSNTRAGFLEIHPMRVAGMRSCRTAVEWKPW
jgi:hypothetical protein